jgi:hypothetical protein
MKIHNKGSSEGKAWSFFGKDLLCSTALIFVSCGKKTQKKENNNIGDFVDFINFGISVEEKAPPASFGLLSGFNLVAGNLHCDRISYILDGSASGFSNTVTNDTVGQDISDISIINRDQFNFKVTAFHCKEGGSGERLVFVVDGEAHTYLDGETRTYKNNKRADLEVTQDGDCTAAICTKDSKIGFSITNFNLEAGDQAMASVSFLESLEIKFANGEPIPAFSLLHVEHLDETYSNSDGSVQLGQVWECDIPNDDAGTDHTAGVNAECSGQKISNLYAVVLDNRSIADDENGVAQDAFPPASDPGNGSAEEEAAKALTRQDEIIDAIQYRYGLANAATLKEYKKMDNVPDHLIATGGSGVASLPVGATGAAIVTYEFTDDNGDTVAGRDLAGDKYGIKVQSMSEPAFYANKKKYVCLFALGQTDGSDDWDKLGVKCQKVVFAPIEQNGMEVEPAEPAEELPPGVPGT